MEDYQRFAFRQKHIPVLAGDADWIAISIDARARKFIFIMQSASHATGVIEVRHQPPLRRALL